MSYPRWLPYPSSWLKAFCLFFFLVPLTMVIQVTGEVFYYILGVESSRDSWKLEFWLLTVVVLIPIIIFSYVDRILWGKSSSVFPKWIPSSKSWLEGFSNWLIVALSYGACFWFFFNRYTQGLVYYSKYWGNSSYYPNNKGDFYFFLVLFVVIAAYLYQFKRFVKEELMKQPKTKNRR